MNKIPSLNLKDFTQGSEQKRIQFVKDLGKAYEEIGFVAISGHFLFFVAQSEKIPILAPISTNLNLN